MGDSNPAKELSEATETESLTQSGLERVSNTAAYHPTLDETRSAGY